MILSTTIATIFSIAGWVNATADVVGTQMDNQVIAESLAQMQSTAYLLKKKAEAETDPVKKEIKMKMSQKLFKSHETLTGESKGDFIGNAKKSGFNVGKAVLGEIAGEAAESYVAKHSVKTLGHYGALQASKTIAVPVAIVDGALENLLTAKKLIFGSKYKPEKTWAQMATSSDSLDTEIELIKAKDLTKQTQSLSDELDEMIKALDAAEKATADDKLKVPETPEIPKTPETTTAPQPIIHGDVHSDDHYDDYGDWGDDYYGDDWGDDYYGDDYYGDDYYGDDYYGDDWGDDYYGDDYYGDDWGDDYYGDDYYGDDWGDDYYGDDYYGDDWGDDYYGDDYYGDDWGDDYYGDDYYGDDWGDDYYGDEGGGDYHGDDYGGSYTGPDFPALDIPDPYDPSYSGQSSGIYESLDQEL